MGQRRPTIVLRRLKVFEVMEGRVGVKERRLSADEHSTFSLMVSEMRLELTRSNDHYPLKVARLPIPPSGH